MTGLFPAPAQAQSNDLARVIVDVADVIFRNGQPYNRHGNYGHDDRLIVARDRYGRPVYYRNAPQRDVYRQGPPYGNAYGYHRNGPDSRDTKCNKHGKCKVTYYDPRHDRDARHDRYANDRRDYRRDDRHDRDHRRRGDNRRRW
ncbi:MAG: hypothetical protein M3374_01030 [Pseudomonadota bacterium]|nr:hypothetical protein [Pseudomonadota bacterium]